MSIPAKKLSESTIYEEIRAHKAWYGNISGLAADKMLRGRKTPYLFMLRKGENEADYYVSFILPDLSIRHQPFTVVVTLEGWEWENAAGGTCSAEESIMDVLHLMMHTEKNQPIALNRLAIK